MLYKPDLDEALRRHEAFWQREPAPRPLLIATSPRCGAAPYRERVVDPVTQWTDIDFIIEERERYFRSTFFAADALPHALVGIQGGVVAAALGCGIEFRRETSWFTPVIHDWESYRLDFRPDSRWWRFTKELTSAVVDAGKGKFLVDLPDYQSDLDTLSDMRGPEPLCLDLYTHPAEVLRALDFIFASAYRPIFEEMRTILTRHTPLTTHWMGLASDRRHDVLQADFLALVSPRMAEQFVIPNLRKEAKFLERSIFHLDGPGALDKLELLLDIEELGGIQWVPGAGRPPAAHWLPLLKRIQARNKILFVSSPAMEVRALVEELDPRGLAIAVEGAFEDEASAEEFVRQVEAWSSSPR